MGPATNAADVAQKKTNESLGFPHAVGLSTYTKTQHLAPVPVDVEVMDLA